MSCFFGILLVSGYCSVPRRRLCWQFQPVTYNEAIAKSLRRDRFDEIMKYFHAIDNPFQTSNHKFAKVQALFDILNTNFSKFGEVFDPTYVSIDEAMNPYFERHPSKQFLRGNPSG
uniref:PiggyBac transposable element-derived protein domain-containing protein n=1 Tax=Lepeophtheirus salmonis TaxID=72036 RepID=A0A0K2TN93_LEPSM